jgi:hypothetical protein
MLKVYVCETTWLKTGVACFQGVHLGAVVVSTFTALSLAIFACLGTCAGWWRV